MQFSFTVKNEENSIDVHDIVSLDVDSLLAKSKHNVSKEMGHYLGSLAWGGVACVQPLIFLLSSSSPSSSAQTVEAARRLEEGLRLRAG